MAFASQKRESLSEQRWRVFWRKTRTYRDKLPDGRFNSNRGNFEPDSKLPGRDTQRKLAEFDGVDLQPIICNTDGVKIGQLPALGHQKPAEFYYFLFSEWRA
jgi:hypothetical protein